MQIQPIIANAGWYIGYTNSNAEKNVVKKMNELGYESFAPFKQELSINSNNMIETPLFPNYVFIKFEKDILERNVMKVDGLNNYICFDGHLAKISENEIEQIKRKVYNSIEENHFSCD
jgi:transcriptional antiterminator RfaH